MGALRVACLVVATLVALSIILIAWAVSVGLRRAARYYSAHESRRFARVRVSEAYPLMETGDLILFVAATHGFTNSMLTGDFFSHAGVVVKVGGRLFLSESAACSTLVVAPGLKVQARPFSRLSPLLARLKHYVGLAHWIPLERPLDEATAEAIAARAQRAYPYPSMRQILAGLAGFRTASRHCFQHAAWLLDGAGLSPAGEGRLLDAGFLGSSNAVSALSGKRLANGNRFGSPLILLYDIDAVPSDSAG